MLPSYVDAACTMGSAPAMSTVLNDSRFQFGLENWAFGLG